jgi:hypothetical protein
MAEAVGVAGSIVGFVSLGIQVSQGLLMYYKSWANQDSTIAELCDSLENLLRTIKELDRLVKEHNYRESTKANV